MTRAEAWALHLANLLVGGTGIVYAVLRYALTPSDPYSVVHHPWQPVVQHLHILVAPLLVFAVGVVWRAHVWKHAANRVPVRRTSGLTLLAMLAPMVASGYLIQTAVDPLWRKIWVGIHLVASALWVLGYAGHLLTPRPAREGAHGRN